MKNEKTKLFISTYFRSWSFTAASVRDQLHCFSEGRWRECVCFNRNHTPTCCTSTHTHTHAHTHARTHAHTHTRTHTHTHAHGFKVPWFFYDVETCGTRMTCTCGHCCSIQSPSGGAFVCSQCKIVLLWV